jgi:HU domain fused to wHTH, Ig, or Glycine-rich motif
MAKKLAAVNQLRPKIVSQNLVDLDEMSRRTSKNTTYNPQEISSILQLFVKDCIAALQAGETVKIDRLVIMSPNMKVGGEVGIALRSDRAAIAGLNNPQLWTADKVANHANLSKDPGELVSLWNTRHPDDPVVEK